MVQFPLRQKWLAAGRVCGLQVCVPACRQSLLRRRFGATVGANVRIASGALCVIRGGGRRAFEHSQSLFTRHARVEREVRSQHRVTCGSLRGEDRSATGLLTETGLSNGALAAHFLVVIVAVVSLRFLLVVFVFRLGVVFVVFGLFLLVFVVAVVRALRVLLVVVFLGLVALGFCVFLLILVFGLVVFSLGGLCVESGEMGEAQPTPRGEVSKQIAHWIYPDGGLDQPSSASRD